MDLQLKRTKTLKPKQRIGRLTVIGVGTPSPGGYQRWLCRCECGKEFNVFATNVFRHPNPACRRCAHTKHGDCYGERALEYGIWAAMKDRCGNPRNPAYAYYGGRGITVCDRWMFYPHFLADMGRRPTPQHSLERNDNGGNYEPSNCRWATKVEQGNNTRTNRWIEYEGKRQTVAQWARERGLEHETLRTRLERGWSISRALETKSQYRPPRAGVAMDALDEEYHEYLIRTNAR